MAERASLAPAPGRLTLPEQAVVNAMIVICNERMGDHVRRAEMLDVITRHLPACPARDDAMGDLARSARDLVARRDQPPHVFVFAMLAAAGMVADFAEGRLDMIHRALDSEAAQ